RSCGSFSSVGRRDTCLCTPRISSLERFLFKISNKNRKRAGDFSGRRLFCNIPTGTLRLAYLRGVFATPLACIASNRLASPRSFRLSKASTVSSYPSLRVHCNGALEFLHPIEHP